MPILQKEQIVGTYTIQFFIKESSYAETYRVKDLAGKRYFMKLIHTAKLNRQQFDEEGRILEIEITKRMQHSHLVNYQDSGELIWNGQKFVYLILHFISGETVSQKVARELHCNVYDTKRIALSVLSGLNYLHTQVVPIIHNEVTIQNVMLDLLEEPSQPKLIDFGFARFLNTRGQAMFKDTNLFYLASERFNGVCSVQTDLYAVGAMIYHLLFGIPPWYITLSPMLGMEQQIERIVLEREKPLKLPEIENLFEFDEYLPNIILKALANDSDDRFHSAEEFIQALNGEIEIGSTKINSDIQLKAVLKKETKCGRGFEDVAGMKELKDILTKQVISVIKDKERAERYKLNIPNGMLLYGPPGCGKSFISEKFAEETGYNYIYVKSSDLASIYVHGSQEKIGKLFEQARKQAPTILCFDEFDSLVPNRDKVNSASQSGEVNEFLSQLNNCGKEGIFVIASTNRPELIDPAVLRRGRIDKIIYLPVPDREARSAMFALHLKGRPTDFGINYEYLATLTENYVSSDIAYIVNEAANIASINNEVITQTIIERVIRNTSPSVKADVLAYYEQLRNRFEGLATLPTRPKIGFNS